MQLLATTPDLRAYLGYGMAQVRLSGAAGRGQVNLSMTGEQTLRVSYSLSGLRPGGAHGFHIHAAPLAREGDCMRWAADSLCTLH